MLDGSGRRGCALERSAVSRPTDTQAFPGVEQSKCSLPERDSTAGGGALRQPLPPLCRRPPPGEFLVRTCSGCYIQFKQGLLTCVRCGQSTYAH